ncbi:aminotransferase class V-fold PLP-dependent enzyme [Planococcus sp. CP5-4]|nr:aminotransferase class V-fold PLP-dependent enzyme [Planococcus sp. CP5-4_YE]MBV0910136.1 aminotransferase class V-fold PLP-dependent enzyme [Planococcus sp. CP5-4_UN]MBW6064657.1 aminotransferase class V-fold PLP-dependent enzyme [Planococcus sp. CP5-4]
MEQIHRLNYETFVEEIPQHNKSQEQRLVDRFHEENTYWIAKQDNRLIGMVALRGIRPFSLDQKLGAIDHYLLADANPCEVRLLSVRQEYRGKRVFFGLLQQVVASCLQQDYNCVLISGTVRQARLYQHLGFRPFGPLIGTENAQYQPMLLTKEYFTSAGKLFDQLTQENQQSFSIRLLPGPVSMHPKVEEAWAMPAKSHRSDSFCKEFASLQTELKHLTGAAHVQLAVGTGTLANELIAGQLSRLGGKGLILSNGEFGERLAEQAKRWQLDALHMRKHWDEPLVVNEVEKLMKQHPDIRWLWTVHCETSTGYLYPLEELKSLCKQQEIRLCLDACSSFGTVPSDFSNVYMASAVSGKGLGSYPGLAIVFHQDGVPPDTSLPAYLDLGLYEKSGTVPFTHSSNSVAALQAAITHHRFPDPLLATEIRNRLMDAGLDALGDERYSPGILTIALPSKIDARAVGDALKASGIEISYESDYLLKRNWIQIALMGDVKPPEVKKATTELIKTLMSAQHSARKS